MAKGRWLQVGGGQEVEGDLGYVGLVSPFVPKQFLFFSYGDKDQTEAELTLSGNSDESGDGICSRGVTESI